jgi:hypothetical protein
MNEWSIFSVLSITVFPYHDTAPDLSGQNDQKVFQCSQREANKNIKYSYTISYSGIPCCHPAISRRVILQGSINTYLMMT